MSSVAFVERAQRMARFIEDEEYRVVGDRGAARERLARRYGFAARVFYTLRYCPPKQIAADLYDALCIAAEDTAAIQIRKLEAEIEQARSGRFGHRESNIRAAEVALGQAERLLRGATE